MPYLQTARRLYSKLETTAGVSADPLDKANAYATPDAEAVRVRDMQFSHTPQYDNEDSKYLNGGYSGDVATLQKHEAGVAFGIKLVAGEYNASPIAHKLNYAKYLKSCGLHEVTAYTGSIAGLEKEVARIYYPSLRASKKTITIAETVESNTGNIKAREAIGCIGNVTIMAESVGAPIMANFEYGGAMDRADGNGEWDILSASVAGLANPQEYMATQAEGYINTRVAITKLGGTTNTYCARSFTLNSANTSTPIDCQLGTTAEAGRIITAMAPRLDINPLLNLESELGTWGAMNEGELYRIEITKDYGDDMPPVTIVIPRAQLLTAPREDQDGKIATACSFRPLENVDKYVPTVNYWDGLSWATWDYTGSDLDGDETEATWYLIIGEKEVA